MGMTTTFDQFRAVLTREYGRRAIGINLPQAEAERIAADETLARAYYENWQRTGADAGRTTTPPSVPPPFRSAASPATAPTATGTPGLAPAIVGLVLGAVGYFLSSTWFGLLAVPGLAASIYAIIEAQRDKVTRGLTAGLVVGIVGVVAAAVAMLLMYGHLTGLAR